MDSVSQFVLGSAVCAAAMGTRASAVRAVLWGGLVATLPDLDVLIDHGNAIENMTRHRAESHSLVWLTVAAPLLAYAIAVVQRERHLFGRWTFAVWLALITHPLLDAMTIYGTQLLLPFSDRPFAVGSLFIIDPLYTLPLAAGVLALLVTRGAPRGRRWNTAGIVSSTAYAAWSLLAQQHVLAVAERSLRAAGVAAERIVASPAPFQTLLWRVTALTPERVYEGLYSLCDDELAMTFRPIDRGNTLLEQLRGSPQVARLEQFTGGFLKAQRSGDEVRIADLRMGSEPDYVFTFIVARFDERGVLHAVAAPERLSFRVAVADGMPWLWRRMWGELVPPPLAVRLDAAPRAATR